MKTIAEKLQKIANDYSIKNFNQDNYYIGGGLDSSKFASRRHEDAKEDEGKLTLGQCTALFVRATRNDIDLVKEVIHYAVPNMEWHHAGKLPKSYGGGMKKTYFLNAEEICNIAENWNDLISKVELRKKERYEELENKKTLEQKRLEFLKANATKIERVTNRPTFFHLTSREMKGKYGWFDSTYKNYNLTEYLSGWSFESEEKYNEFLKIN